MFHFVTNDTFYLRDPLHTSGGLMSKHNAFKQDLIASTVVFLVAIPLCLGIALASNAPLFSGILSGVIGGIIIGSLSRSHVSVSGPAAGLVAVVVAAIHDLGSFESFLLALTLSGLLQFMIGKLKAGFIADYVPGNVIQGLLCAIGVLIIVKQIPFAFGYFAKSQTILNELQDAQKEHFNLANFTEIFDNISLGAVTICSMSLALLFSWQKVTNKTLKLIPGPVLVVIFGIVSNLLFLKFIPLLHLSNRDYLVTIPAIERLIDVKHLFSFPEWAAVGNIKIYFYAVLLALVSTIETLLNLEAAEKIDTQKRYCDRNQEMIAQGIGNTISGLLGGLPITSVIVRSSVNVQSGSKTKLSTIMHGIWLLLSVLLIPNIINMIPLASLAAILIFVGIKLANINIFKSMYQRGIESFMPFIITTVMIVSTDLLLGVICGLIVSAIFVMKYNAQPSFEKQLEVYPNGEVLRIRLPQQATFLLKAALITTLRKIPNNSNVLLDASKTLYIDHDIREVITDFSKNLSNDKNISVRTEGFKRHYEHALPEDFTTITTAYTHERLKPIDVLNILKEGNKRFIKSKLLSRDIPLHLESTATDPKPLAVVLGCIDARVPVEIIFDATVGELFVTRVLGNMLNDDVISSLEFACGVSGAKLIVVMGHTQCGAITLACEQSNAYLTNKLKDTMNTVNNKISFKENKENYINEVILENVKQSKMKVLEQSAILTKLYQDKKIDIVGAIYDIKTGQIKFDDNHMN